MFQNRDRAVWGATSAPSVAARPRILVVDPDDDTRSLYREWFRICGCDVVEATDGREALAEALVRPPALVVTEARLPFIDGYALCDILRRDHVTKSVPILVVTSETRASELTRAKTSGATAVLVKPATPEQILAEMQRLLVDGTVGQALVAGAQPEEAAAPPVARHRRASKSLVRVATTTPPLAPPPAICPSCDRILTYRHSHLGGVSEREREQWDWYACSGACGMFEYRHRTRRLRQLIDDDDLG
jgi:two-component system, chemotaxis family, chemotaxis protein CheY